MVRIAENVMAEVVQGEILPVQPRYQLGEGYVLVASYTSMEQREQHLLYTQGSADWFWSGVDDLRFDTDRGQLQVDLLFADDTYQAWAITNPTHYLVDGWEMPVVPANPDQLIGFFDQYLSIVSEITK